jgi:hypothetical protein
MITAQVDDSGHQIPRDPVGKMRESHRIPHENTGNRWNMEAVFRPGIVRIFSCPFLSTSCASRHEPTENHRKKSKKLPAGILLPQHHPELAVSGQDCSTWAYVE